MYTDICADMHVNMCRGNGFAHVYGHLCGTIYGRTCVPHGHVCEYVIIVFIIVVIIVFIIVVTIVVIMVVIIVCYNSCYNSCYGSSHDNML